ncbi:MAG TPA: dihydrofolate reductase family protein [Solirubrobacteraceae bacterium]|nr:dihydrofolate reductase family protein [Solirubrobacteraceae bacterium]
MTTASTPTAFTRLLPNGDGAGVEALAGSVRTFTAAELAAELHSELCALEEGDARAGPGAQAEPSARPPYTLLNMIASADGRATEQGRSGPLGARADRELFHALRTVPDAVLIGARTLRIERYNRIVAEPQARAARAARGLEAEPLACVISSSLELDPELPLLADPEAHVVIITANQATLSGVRAQVDYVRVSDGAQVDLIGAFCELRERFGVKLLLCEGGPHTALELVRAGLLDELLLTISPRLTGGDIASSPAGSRGVPAEVGELPEAALPILSGEVLQPPVGLSLVSVHSTDSFLFLRYRLRR